MPSREQENSETILQVFRAIEARDAARFVESLTPDFEISWPPSLPYGGVARGTTPQSNSWGTTWAPLQPEPEDRKMDPRVVAAHGDEVVVLWRQRGRDATGNRCDEEVLGLYRFKNGKLARAQMFYFDTTATARFLANAK